MVKRVDISPRLLGYPNNTSNFPKHEHFVCFVTGRVDGTLAIVSASTITMVLAIVTIIIVVVMVTVSVILIMIAIVMK